MYLVSINFIHLNHNYVKWYQGAYFIENLLLEENGVNHFLRTIYFFF
jgi:hypothetical protein